MHSKYVRLLYIIYDYMPTYKSIKDRHGERRGTFRGLITFREEETDEQWRTGCFYYILIFSKWSFEPFVATYYNVLNLVIFAYGCLPEQYILYFMLEILDK